MSIKRITTGQDSFLDIVANLVGILIILVVVVSAQAGSANKQPQANLDLEQKVSQLEQDLSRSSDTVAKLQTDNQQLETRIIEENQLAASLTEKRHAMLVQLGIVKKQIAKKRVENKHAIALQNRKQELARQQHAVVKANHEAAIAKQKEAVEKRIRIEIELEAARRDLESQLDEIQRELNAVQVSQPKTETIDHFPSPIAKTVFAEEVHFRLADGRLSYVPMDELIATMKSEWKVKSEKLQQADRTIETVGPISNYRLQYELSAHYVKRRTQYGEETGRSVKFKQFTIYPLAGQFGEDVETAIRPGSAFQKRLSRHQTANTTVSIWVYPDSFADHNRIKSWLHENGFQVASWPLQNGKRISGGPDGFKTSAQ